MATVRVMLRVAEAATAASTAATLAVLTLRVASAVWLAERVVALGWNALRVEAPSERGGRPRHLQPGLRR